MGIRHDLFLPWDQRMIRVHQLLNEPINQTFRNSLRNNFAEMAAMLDAGQVMQFAVAPHPKDLRIWYVLSCRAGALSRRDPSFSLLGLV